MTQPANLGAPQPQMHDPNFGLVNKLRQIRTDVRKLQAFNRPGFVALSLVAGFTANSFGFTPAYCVYPNGRVELRGNVFRTAGLFTAGTWTLVSALPAEITPLTTIEACGSLAAGSGSTVHTARVEVATGPGKINVLITSAMATNWVSLDSIFYYTN